MRRQHRTVVRWWMSRLIWCACCVCWPGVCRRAAKAEPALTPGRGGAQRSRLDLNTAQFGNATLGRPEMWRQCLA
jgi:hypothetical protein